MAVNSKKIDVKDLVIGMYVSKLDRPWIETSYSIEGFYIKDDSDIRQLNSLCRFVYIDVDLTRLRVNLQQPDRQLYPGAARFSIQSSGNEKHSEKPSPTRKPKLRKATPLYTLRVPFEKEYKTASKLFETITHTAEEVLNEISAGQSINVEKIKKTAISMVDSIVRNPDTFLWLSRLKAKDTHTHNRSIRATILAIAFGRYLSLPKQELIDLSTAVLLSNIGKARLPRDLLEKSDVLQGEALLEYQNHVNISVQILKEMGRFAPHVIDIVAAHCERYDGSGYPRQLSQYKIIFPAQIAGLVGYYEKITNHRDHNKSMDSARAMEHLYKLRDTRFQAELVEEFIQSIGIYPAGSLIELNSREIAVIVEQNDNYRLLPKVMILRDSNKKPVNLFKILDLSYLSSMGDKEKCPRIINSIPLGAYDISAQEIIDSLLKADKNWLMKKLFS